MQQSQNILNPKAIKAGVIIIFSFITIILLILTLQKLFHKNPYGNEIKIDNFSEYYPTVPEDRRDVVFSNLYKSIASNSSPNATIPNSGALIRENSATSNYDEGIQNYYGSFIVDIAEIQQSYDIQFSWVEDKKTPLFGDSLLITCVHGDEVIYDNFICSDSQTEQNKEDAELLKRYPIMTDLPINIEYYKGGYGAYTHYRISGNLTYMDNNEYTYEVIISDYTGGNYESAIQRIKDLGYNPDDYKITYHDYFEEPGLISE